MMLTGRFVDADEAHRIGLVTDLVADAQLLATALLKAEEIRVHSAFAVALTKEGMWASVETPGLRAAMVLEDRQQAIGLVSADHRALVREFLS
jgi:enoyl-CoA hydratase